MSRRAWPTNDQLTLVPLKEWWREHWKGMPDFFQEDLRFKEKPSENGLTYEELERASPRYPIYIVSKGRAKTRPTSKVLDRMGVPYRIVIEPQEFEAYSEYIETSRISVLPFSNLGQGSIPARNWIWEHAISLGARRHWILDDNIYGFSRLCRNRRIKVSGAGIFRAAEDFVDRYKNIALSGFHYEGLINPAQHHPPFVLNKLIYSCILINNDAPYRWRGMYNEDSDLCLRALKGGWCTVKFFAFLQKKCATMLIKGGNADIYVGDGRLKMAQSLRDQHPDIVEVRKRFGRWQHHVNCRIFKKNKLAPNSASAIPEDANEYGMQLLTSRSRRSE